MQSRYRSGLREIPNEAWNKADLAYETANLSLQKAQGTLTASQSKNNKKQIEEADRCWPRLRHRYKASAKMNSIPKTLSDDVVSAYNYTRTTLEVTNIVEMSFRILDAGGNTLGEPIRVTKGDQAKMFVILDNIKPDDTTGLKEIDAQPDEIQLMTDVEIETRDAMVKAARDRVQELPQKILAQARARAASSDLDSAGESYVLYLDCTPAAPTPERAEAAHSSMITSTSVTPSISAHRARSALPVLWIYPTPTRSANTKYWQPLAAAAWALCIALRIHEWAGRSPSRP